MVSVEVLTTSPGVSIALIGGVFTLHLRQRLPIAEIARIHRLVAKLGDRGRGFLLVVAPEYDVTPPGEDERRAWVAVVDESKRHAIAGAVVLRREGFGGAVLRAGVSAVALLSRGKQPTKFFLRPADGIAWLHGLKACESGVTAAELERAWNEFSVR